MLCFRHLHCQLWQTFDAIIYAVPYGLEKRSSRMRLPHRCCSLTTAARFTLAFHLCLSIQIPAQQYFGWRRWCFIKLIFPERSPTDIAKAANSRDFKDWRKKTFGDSCGEKKVDDGFLSRLHRAMIAISASYTISAAPATTASAAFVAQQELEAEADVEVVRENGTAHQDFGRGSREDNSSTSNRSAVSTPAALSGSARTFPTIQAGGIVGEPRMPAIGASVTDAGRIMWSMSAAQQLGAYATRTQSLPSSNPGITEVSSILSHLVVTTDNHSIYYPRCSSSDVWGSPGGAAPLQTHNAAPRQWVVCGDSALNRVLLAPESHQALVYVCYYAYVTCRLLVHSRRIVSLIAPSSQTRSEGEILSLAL